jgi:hypothetical protein
MGPTSSRAQDSLLDCGADDTVFPEDLAALVGIDLRNAPEAQAIGLGPSRARVKYAEAALRITDGHELREWRAWVGFTPARLKRPLLGFAGFQQFFEVILRGDREEVELTVNGLYPGT